jgi:hypothetical protein
MVAIKYRMAGGHAGEVNRTHPASIEAVAQNASTPVLGYGFGCLVDAATGTIRQLAAGDTAGVSIWGITVRPYPQQQYTDTVGWGSAAFGNFTPPGAGNVIDVLRDGYIMVPCFGAAQKSGAAFVRCQNAVAGQPIGGFEAVDDGANTMNITNVVFNSGPDAGGIAEVIIRGQ